MFAGELIGKKAIRTKPAGSDHSYTDSPIIILAATDNHIVYTYPPKTIFGDEKHILNFSWCDDGWTDYDELMSLVGGTC